MKKRMQGRLTVVALTGVLILIAGMAMLLAPVSEARAAVQTVWRSAQAAGGYAFRADITQHVVPLASQREEGAVAAAVPTSSPSPASTAIN